MRDRVADLLFDHDYGLGLEIVRYNIGGSDTNTTAVNSLRPGAAVPSLLLPNGTYDWTLVSNCDSPMLHMQHDRLPEQMQCDSFAAVTVLYTNESDWLEARQTNMTVMTKFHDWNTKVALIGSHENGKIHTSQVDVSNPLCPCLKSMLPLSASALQAMTTKHTPSANSQYA